MARQRRAVDAENEAEQFSALFRQHYAQIVVFARRRVGPDACQEIAAETFLVAWRRFDSVPDTALPWLYQVANFTIANHRRREAKTVPYGASTNLDRFMGPSHPDEDYAGDGLITRAFASLSPKDQEVLRLAAWDGLNSAEGAAVLGCSIAAFKVRLHRARSRLAKRLTTPQVHPRAAERPSETTVPISEKPTRFGVAEESA
jgi:RNA polymerase sigma-70 factor (ECF subfamily)